MTQLDEEREGALRDPSLHEPHPSTLEYGQNPANQRLRQFFNLVCAVVAAMAACLTIGYSAVIFYFAFTGLRADFGAAACPAIAFLLFGLTCGFLAWKWSRRALRDDDKTTFFPDG